MWHLFLFGVLVGTRFEGFERFGVLEGFEWFDGSELFGRCERFERGV